MKMKAEEMAKKWRSEMANLVKMAKKMKMK